MRITGYVSASATRNHALGDPLVDFLNHRYGKQQPDQFTAFIQDRGCSFETEIVKQVRTNHLITQITTNPHDEASLISKAEETIAAMRSGAPLIYQGVLHNHKLKTYGAPDFLIRSDYLDKLFKNVSVPDKKQSSRLTTDFHYKILDVKFTTLHLRADLTHLLNVGSVPAYKVQLCVYNDALSETQGYASSTAYILGRSVRRGDFRYGSFDQPGVVDYQYVDYQYKVKTGEAVDWLLNMQNHQQPCPGKSKSSDHRELRQQIADQTGEITQVWYCGVKQRENALRAGVTSWRDPRCSASLLGVRGEQTSTVVNHILNINRSSEQFYIPDGFRMPRFSNEIFVDFETVNSVHFNPVTDARSFTLVFMIGVYHRDRYFNFTADSLTLESEKNILAAFHLLLSEIQEQNQDQVTALHWAPIERTLYSELEQRHGLSFPLEWYDLCSLFKTEPIVVRGAFNFTLKSITRALNCHGLINCKYDTESLSDGLSAMISAVKYYKSDQAAPGDQTLAKISEYNRIDCLALSEITKFLRRVTNKRARD